MSGKKLKVLRKSDLKKQPYPPPEVIEHIGITMEAASGELPLGKSSFVCFHGRSVSAFIQTSAFLCLVSYIVLVGFYGE